MIALNAWNFVDPWRPWISFIDPGSRNCSKFIFDYLPSKTPSVSFCVCVTFNTIVLKKRKDTSSNFIISNYWNSIRINKKQRFFNSTEISSTVNSFSRKTLEKNLKRLGKQWVSSGYTFSHQCRTSFSVSCAPFCLYQIIPNKGDAGWWALKPK